VIWRSEVDPIIETTGRLSLGVCATALVLQKIMLPISVTAVGMWAPRLWCPSEVAYPQSCRLLDLFHASAPHRLRHLVVHRLVEAILVVKFHPRTNASACFVAFSVGLQMYFFIFDRPPQALDENIIEETPLSIYQPPSFFDEAGGVVIKGYLFFSLRQVSA
jgi:hypothetical protein